MSDSSCAAVRDFNVAAKEAFRQFSLLVVLSAMIVINMLLDFFAKKVIPRFAVYKHLEAETCEELGMRMMQLLFGPIILLSGIGFMLYQAITGCNSNEVYVFFIAGLSLVAIDAHELIRRWPLRAPLLAHHLMTFAITIAFVEFDALPPNEDKTIDWTTVLFLTLIGCMWIVDFFHVVYRTSEDINLIKKLRKIYLFLAPVRCANTVLLALGGIQSAFFGVWFGFASLLFMALAYMYNSYKAITFVWAFDCERYYNSHQKKWFAIDRESATPESTENESSSSENADRTGQIVPILVDDRGFVVVVPFQVVKALYGGRRLNLGRESGPVHLLEFHFQIHPQGRPRQHIQLRPLRHVRM